MSMVYMSVCVCGLCECLCLWSISYTLSCLVIFCINISPFIFGHFVSLFFLLSIFRLGVGLLVKVEARGGRERDFKNVSVMREGAGKCLPSKSSKIVGRESIRSYLSIYLYVFGSGGRRGGW